MRFLLDTNVCIRVLRGDPVVAGKMSASSPNDCGVSMVSVCELFSGVARCGDPVAARRKVMEFLAPLHLVPFDWDSALKTAAIRWDLEKMGRPIGPYDLQLAGQALALDLILITHNTHEFARVEGLRLDDWELP